MCRPFHLLNLLASTANTRENLLFTIIENYCKYFSLIFYLCNLFLGIPHSQIQSLGITLRHSEAQGCYTCEYGPLILCYRSLSLNRYPKDPTGSIVRWLHLLEDDKSMAKCKMIRYWILIVDNAAWPHLTSVQACYLNWKKKIINLTRVKFYTRRQTS